MLTDCLEPIHSFHNHNLMSQGRQGWPSSPLQVLGSQGWPSIGRQVYVATTVSLERLCSVLSSPPPLYSTSTGSVQLQAGRPPLTNSWPVFDHMITIWAPIGPYQFGNKCNQIICNLFTCTDFVTYQYSKPGPSADNKYKYIDHTNVCAFIA